MRLVFIALIYIFLFWNYGYAEEVSTPLRALKVLPVEGPEFNQPSGLTIFKKMLFTVSDKHDDTIFRIQLMKDKALLVPHIHFNLNEPAPFRGFDFEGITCDEKGNFYIVSESCFRILKVTSDGKNVSWITPCLRSDGEKAGLFKTRAAYLEGIAYLGNGQFVVCAERDPRGIIEVNTNIRPISVKAFKLDHSRLKLAEGRSYDFTGLFWENGVLYALERNLYALCSLTKTPEGYEEKTFWSYKDIVTSEFNQYENMIFGRGEGLCMDENHIYVILDNNGDARQNDPNDRRPLLLIMKR